MNKEKIKEQAKKIMDEFIEALDKAEEVSDFGEIREKNKRENINFRDEPNFRKRMFKNAPKKNEDYIIAEKKNW